MSSVTLWSVAPPGFSVHEIFQAILGCVAISFSRGSSQPMDGTQVSCLGGWLLLSQQGGISLMALCHVSDRHSQPKLSQVHQSITDPYPSDGQMPCHAKLLQFNTADCSSPGSPVHWSLQARILEWVAISCSRGSFRTRDRTHIS